MLTWIEEERVGVGQALDPNASDNPAAAISYTTKWGVPTPLVAPQFNGTFWFWELAPQSEWVPQFGAANSLRGTQALAVWNQFKANVISGPYVRNPPYVFQAGLAPPGPGPVPVPPVEIMCSPGQHWDPVKGCVPNSTPQQPTPTPPPIKPAVSSSSDFWKPTLTVGAIIAGIAALAWYAT